MTLHHSLLQASLKQRLCPQNGHPVRTWDLSTDPMVKIHNGNWTERSAIWSEIIRVISKSNERAARVRFETISMISDQNCTIRSSIVTLLLITILKSHNLISQICQMTMAFFSFIFLQCDWLVWKSFKILLVVLFYWSHSQWLFRKRGVRSAECGVRSAECGVRSAESKKKFKKKF